MTPRPAIAGTVAAVLAAVLAAAALSACAARPAGTHARPASSTTPTSDLSGADTSAAAPTTSRAAADPSSTLTPAALPSGPAATADPTAVARAWALSANSSSYLDTSPGQWTTRTAGLVTGAEARAESAERLGDGGTTWSQIQADRCITTLRDLTAALPSDTPSGPTRHIVYVSATIALVCATGTVTLTPYAAQLTVQRIDTRWLVTDVTY